MKKLLFLLLLPLLISCKGGTVHHDNIDNYATVIVDSCEYIYDVNIGEQALVHKGNCTTCRKHMNQKFDELKFVLKYY